MAATSVAADAAKLMSMSTVATTGTLSVPALPEGAEIADLGSMTVTAPRFRGPEASPLAAD